MLTFRTIADREAYTAERFNFIKTVEGSESWPYIDTKGIATIGVGFNLRIKDNRNEVLEVLGINPDSNDLSATGKAKELGYKNEIVNILTKRYPANLKGAALDRANQQLQDALDAVMTRRKNDPLITIPNKENVFGLSDSEMKSVFDFIMPVYEKKVDDWVTNIPDSKERIVLESLAYNTKDGSRSLLGEKLADAIVADNRAEAWYEIRYNSNGDKKQGIANRRYQEAQLFGLRNEGNITIDDAKETLRMYARHELFAKDSSKKIGKTSTYESKYALPTGISSIGIEISEAKNLLINNYSLGRPIDTVIVGAGLTTYQYLEKSSDDNFIGTDKNDLILGEKGDDWLYGGTGADVIYGGSGNDQITGGIGDDYLIGGTGNDTYYFSSGDGNDWIYDEDNRGTIVVGNNSENLERVGNVYRTIGSANVWRDASGWVSVTHNSPWKIVLDDGSTIELGENLQDGDFGINLIDMPSNPTTTNTITGDLKPMDFDPDTEGIQTRTDEWGNIITNPAQPDPGKNDLLYDTTGNDMIVSGGGAGDDFDGWYLAA